MPEIRALVTIAGNPVVSNPDSRRLAEAIAGLDFVASVDIYRNETTRLAQVILPGTSPFEDGHYDSFLGGMTWRNTALLAASVPARGPPRRMADDARPGLGGDTRARPSPPELDAFEDEIVAQAVRGYVSDETEPLAGRDVQETLAAIGPQCGVERLHNLGFRALRWGDAFGPRGAKLESAAADGKAQLLHEPPPGQPGELLLIGRRNIQTNNPWLHNLSLLAKGPARCVLEMHPADADTRGLAEGDLVAVRSRIDTVVVPVRITSDLTPGVVCLPHGFSAAETPEQPVVQQRSAATGSANANRLAAAADVDLPSTTVVLNGIPVTCERLGRPKDGSGA